jgi:hypothetical protein
MLAGVFALFAFTVTLTNRAAVAANAYRSS